jgi:hypothetical protein
LICIFILNILLLKSTLKVHRKKKIYLFLSGGFGNQLFQYAYAKNLSIKNKANLIVDSYSGFLFDLKYFRNFCLNIKTKKKIVFFFNFFRVFKKLFLKNKLINKLFFKIVINEFPFNKRFNKKILDLNIKKDLYLFGLFQSDKYFIENTKMIINELMPSKPKLKNFLIKQKEIVHSNSIIIGFRFFEESSDSAIKEAGGVVSINFYKKSIKLMLTRVKNPKFYIFSQNLNNLKKNVKKIHLLENYFCDFITPQNGFKDENANLWLMSHSKNFIIPNSTFFWWAAYFSKYRFKNNNVICSGNFPNKDTCLNTWNILK